MKSYIRKSRLRTCTGLLLPLLLGFGGNAFGQVASKTQNYVVETTVKSYGKKTTASLAGLLVDSANRSIQYLDGLGRPLQTVQWQGSPTRKDIVQPVVYDEFGREVFKYLPYADQNSFTGMVKANAVSDLATFYNTGTGNVTPNSHPFSKTVFEPSPLNRVLEQGAPGQTWQPSSSRTSSTGRTVVTDYGTNAASDVRVWTVAGLGATSGFYDANKLYRTTVKDENWTLTDGKAGTTDEYKDLEGHIVLKRVWETNTKSLSTYYVYDDFGNLRYVLPPAVNENSDRGSAITSFTEAGAVFKQFIYGYHYDERQRQIEKKIPGKGWEYMIYNTLDQMVLTQDTIQKNAGKWIYTKYDVLGRVTSTGIFSNAADRATLQPFVTADTASNPLWESRSGADYTNLAYPRSNTTPLTINYYDDYGFTGGSTFLYSSVSAKTKGLQTGTKVNVLGTSDMLLSVMYYDDEAQLVKSFNQHYKNNSADANNYDEVSNVYNFAGELKESTRRHFNNGTEALYAHNKYTYDHTGRKLKTEQKTGLNSGTTNQFVALSANQYNEIGQLISKDQGEEIGYPFLQHTNYAYNERGWMKTAGSSLFSMELKYQNGTVPQYNGNISQQVYTNLASNTFSYSYDKLNRLTNSVAGNDLGEVISYDVMGNIKSLARDGFGTNDYHIDLYEGNQLKKISGFVNKQYTYNGNGNLIADGLNGINIAYNYLNLPKQVTGSQTVTYTYDAAGRKLRKQSAALGITDYVNGIHYKPDGTIDFVQTEEGIARNHSNVYNYEYNLTDHLGNVRVSFYRHPSTRLLEDLQRDDYYTFGERKVAKQGTNKYLYNGKELQEELGQLDYGARFYDPVIGRWNVIDPMAEDYMHWSPYNYAMNSPLVYIDPDGMNSEAWTTRYVDPNGNTIVNTNDGSQDVVKVPWNRLNEFVENAYWARKGHSDSYSWNYRWKQDLGVLIAESTLNDAGHYLLETESARAAQVKYFITGKASDFKDFVYKRFSASWSDPVSVVNNMTAGATGYLAMAKWHPNSFQSLLKNPRSIWGLSEKEVEKILGKGWKRSNLNSGDGWKFTQEKGDGFVSYTIGNSHHPNSTYYKINNGSSGKTKVVGENYVPTKNDKSRIIYGR